HLEVHERREALSDLGQEPDRILAGLDMLEMQIKRLLAPALELPIREAVLDRHEDPAEQGLELAELGVHGAEHLAIQRLDVRVEVVLDGLLQALQTMDG